MPNAVAVEAFAPGVNGAENRHCIFGAQTQHGTTQLSNGIRYMIQIFSEYNPSTTYYSTKYTLNQKVVSWVGEYWSQVATKTIDYRFAYSDPNMGGWFIGEVNPSLEGDHINLYANNGPWTVYFYNVEAHWE